MVDIIKSGNDKMPKEFYEIVSAIAKYADETDEKVENGKVDKNED